MGLAAKGLLQDMGVSVEVQDTTDSGAAKSIASMRGTSRVLHIDVRELGHRTESRKES